MPDQDTAPVRTPVERIAYSPTEAAEALGVSRQFVYNMMAAGLLRSVKLGRARRIPAAEVYALVGGGPDAPAT